jgi:mannose-6-phosphate isomerase-like protein (cupin superfamily)
VQVPAGAVVSFDAPPVMGLEHHLWMLEGALTIDVDGSRFDLAAGDCLRYVLTGPSRFEGGAAAGARYVIAMVHP